MNRYTWNKEQIEEAVKESTNYREVLRKLGIKISGNNGETLKRKIQEFDIDISHFTFHAKTLSTKKDVFSYLKQNSSIHTSKLKQKLLDAGLKENKCEICGCQYWRDKIIICQLHHINGDNTDNRLENLQMLCPNCHSQTDNYCGQANKAEKPINHCAECGRPLKSLKSTYCPSCAAKRRKKIILGQTALVDLLRKHLGNRTAAASEIGVSETAIRKWCKCYNMPTKSKELKKFLGL